MAGRKTYCESQGHNRRCTKQPSGRCVTFQLVFTEQYCRRAESFLKHHPNLKKQYLKALKLLETDPHHPSLRLHALVGQLGGLHSVSITRSYRITLELEFHDRKVIPINVGNHDAVY